MAGDFVAAEVEGADDEGIRFGGEGDRSVGFVLLIFGRKPFAVDEEVFCAVETDPFRPALGDGGAVLGLIDVGREDDLDAVEGHRWFFADVLEFVLQAGVFFDQLTVFEEGLVGGVENDQPVVAI